MEAFLFLCGFVCVGTVQETRGTRPVARQPRDRVESRLHALGSLAQQTLEAVYAMYWQQARQFCACCHADTRFFA